MKPPRFAPASVLAPVLALGLALGAAACSPPAEPSAPPPAGPAVVEPAAPVEPAGAPGGVPYAPGEALLAGDSVTFPNPSGRGTGLTLAFGRPQADIVNDGTIFRGVAPTISENRECGAGPVTLASWGDGLSLLFQDRTLVGWAAGPETPRSFTTLTGIGVGSPLIDLRTAHPGIVVAASSLGPEFAADDVFGLASGTGPVDRVTHLWAGVSCNFR
jgi:hypothetical protein